MDKLFLVSYAEIIQSFPDMKGFSRSNLYYIYQWYNFHKGHNKEIQRLVGQIPWGYNLAILTKIAELSEDNCKKDKDNG